MKLYIVNTDKLRNAMKKVAKSRNTNMSAIMNQTAGISDTTLVNADARYERASKKDLNGFIGEEFSQYGIFYDDTFTILCNTFSIEKEAFIEKEIEQAERRKVTLPVAFKEIDSLEKRIKDLEDMVLNLANVVEKMRKGESK